jgi:hypothetical protein
MDGDDGVLAIVLATQHLLDLGRLHLLVERVERLAELRVDRLACLDPFGQHAEIVALLPQRGEQIAVLLQAPAALEDLLRFGLIFPEVRVSGPGLELGQFGIGAGGFKDSSAGLQRAG